MNKPLHNWFYKNKLSTKVKMLVLSGVVASLIVIIGGGSWYYFHSQTQKREALERQRLADLQNKRSNIHQFYLTALSGTSAKGFLTLYKEILHSRQPIEMAGFIEDTFKCDAQSCSFTYRAQDETIFNSQDKVFWGEKYPASFSEESTDYQELPSKADENPLLASFNQQGEIKVAACSNMLNYIHGYNSLAEKERNFILEELPASTVENDEASLPGNPENYGLLAGKWKVSLPDNYVDVFSFWNNQPYQSSFIIQNVEKNKDTLDIDGTFLCKK